MPIAANGCAQGRDNSSFEARTTAPYALGEPSPWLAGWLAGRAVGLGISGSRRGSRPEYTVPVTEIGTERLIMRGWRESDLAPWAAMNADPEVRRYLGPLLTSGQAQAWVLNFQVEGQRTGGPGPGRAPARPPRIPARTGSG